MGTGTIDTLDEAVAAHAPLFAVRACSLSCDRRENTCGGRLFGTRKVYMESWLATYRHRMGGVVQSAAALVTQLFKVMLGKCATLHQYGQP